MAKTGFRAKVKLEDGLKKTIEWYVDNRMKTENRNEIFSNNINTK